MSIPIFLSYIDYCMANNKIPEVKELMEWKKKYNYR